MHSKAEIDKVQGIISDFRQEVKSTISQSKKESSSFTKRQDEEVKNLRQDVDQAKAHSLQGISSL